MSKTVLITGSNGFTGKYLSREFESSAYHVIGSVHGVADNAKNEVSVDLCDLKALKALVSNVKPDFVVHLAAISNVAHGDAEAIYRTNIVGSRNLLQALAESNKRPECVLIASSANIYGNATEDPITESTLASPVNDYAISKLAMEYMAKLWMEKLPVAIVRPFNYAGLGQSSDFILPKIVEHFLRREKSIELGNLDVARDFSDVRMVVNIYRRLLEANCAGKTFNICSGIAVTLNDILSMMADISGHQIEVRVNPEFVRENEIKSMRGDNRKLINAIGNINIIPLQDTLEWMFKEGFS